MVVMGISPSIFSAKKSVNTPNIGESTNEESLIKEVVEKYFNWHFQSVNNLTEENILELDSIIENDVLKKFKLTTTTLQHKWYQSFDDGLAEYSVQFDYKGITIEDDKATVVLEIESKLREKGNFDVL